MADGQTGGRRGKGAEDLILRTIAAHADSLLRTARRYSVCPEDAQDAYQRALEIFMSHADRLDGAKAAAWLHVVVKREAQTIRRSRGRFLVSHDVDLDDQEAPSLPTPDERLASVDLVGRAAEALQRLKPQELRALWLKAQGHSYGEISALTGWSYTKVNRCLTEGRRSFLSRYATIESGAECERWLAVISAMADGEATSEQIVQIRPHLRNCPGCRATLKTLQSSAEPLSAVLPIPLLGAVAAGEDHVVNLVTRAYEAVAGGFQERAIHSFTKAQGFLEAASAGKLAAVAASAAAVAGGGYATVERQLPGVGSHRPEKSAAQVEPRDSGVAPGVQAREASAVRRTTTTTPHAKNLSEFAAPAPKQSVSSPEFGRSKAPDVQFARAAAAGGPSVHATSASAPRPKRAPEFSPASSSPEFGG